MNHSHRLQAARELLQRYAAVLSAAWQARAQMATPERGVLERQFLPAALEIQDSPPHPFPRVLLWILIAAFTLALLWSCLGHVDTVAVAQGKVIASGQSKLIQPIETAAVKRIHVHEGQRVRAGQVLIELDATTAGSEATQARDAWQDANLSAARARSLLAAQDSAQAPRLALPPTLGSVIDPATLAKEQTLLDTQHHEYRSRLAALETDYSKREAERHSVEEQVAKLEQTLPIARQRAADYKRLVDEAYVSRHGYLEREQARIEAERDLATQRAKLLELAAALRESRQQREAYRAEYRRQTSEALAQAEAKISSLAQDVKRTENKQRLMQLIAPVAGTVQQLAVHTEGGVVTPAQALMVLVPENAEAEVEAVLENKDVGFVKPGQSAEVKIDTFPFTRYGTIPAQVSFVSQDAVQDERRGLVFPVRLKLKHTQIHVDQRSVNLSAGMSISAEVKTGRRRLIEYLLSPVREVVSESFGAR